MTDKHTLGQILSDAEDIQRNEGGTEDEALRDAIGGKPISFAEVVAYRDELDAQFGLSDAEQAKQDAADRQALTEIDDEAERGLSL